jgi:hypothetical protein
MILNVYKKTNAFKVLVVYKFVLLILKRADSNAKLWLWIISVLPDLLILVRRKCFGKRKVKWIISFIWNENMRMLLQQISKENYSKLFTHATANEKACY